MENNFEKEKKEYMKNNDLIEDQLTKQDIDNINFNVAYSMVNNSIRLNYPHHKHPHGVGNMEPNVYRVWICDECDHIFADDEIRKDISSGKWAHDCKCHPKRKGQRCESHLEPFIPEINNGCYRVFSPDADDCVNCRNQVCKE